MPGWQTISWIFTVSKNILVEHHGPQRKTMNPSNHIHMPGWITKSWVKHARAGSQTLVCTFRRYLFSEALNLSYSVRPLTLTWRIISLSKWLITLVSKSPKLSYSISMWVTPPATNHLLNGMILLVTHPCQSWKPDSGVHLSALPLFRGPI